MKQRKPKDKAAGDKAKEKDRDPAKPKRAPSAFFIFASERRADPATSEKAPAALGEAWKALTDEEKAVRVGVGEQRREEGGVGGG